MLADQYTYMCTVTHVFLVRCKEHYELYISRANHYAISYSLDSYLNIQCNTIKY